jgi:hypothetical protein
MKRIAQSGVAIAFLLSLFGRPGVAQNQAPSNSQSSSTTSAAGPSLGDYARQIRKNAPSVAKTKVFDNDNLPKEDKLSIVGNATGSGASEPTRSGEAAETAENKTPSAGAAAPEQAEKQAAWKQWGERLDSQKDQIDLLARELDVLQREYQLRAAAVYADAGNRLRNSANWDKEDAQYKQQIADKQKALDEAKDKLGDMQEEARKAGVPDSALGQ